MAKKKTQTRKAGRTQHTLHKKRVAHTMRRGSGKRAAARRLFRSGKERMIAGVCGGLAEYLHVDVIWVRLFFVLMLFVHGGGLLLYIILWIVVPRNPAHDWEDDTGKDDDLGHDDEKTAQMRLAAKKTEETGKERRSSLFLGIILILAGIFFLGNQFWHPWFGKLFFSVALIVFGVLLMVYAKKGEA